MKRFLGFAVGVFLVIGFISSAEAVIKIETATMQNGVAFIQGNGAVRGAQIFWEGWVVTTANKNNGGFSFFGVVPNDCVGALSDQPGGATPINVQELDCTPTPIPTVGVLKTGSTLCLNLSGVLGPCPGNPVGQDGEFQKGTARRYTSNADATITDNSTGLVWEKLTSDGTIHDVNDSYAWVDAFAKIAVLNTVPCFAGHCDWRLPNVNELATLVNFGTNVPAIDPVFNNGVDSFMLSDSHWSSTPVCCSGGNAWLVAFGSGGVGPGQLGPGRVRAVRGP